MLRNIVNYVTILSLFILTYKGTIMSKELNVIDTFAIDQSAVVVAPEVTELNDLSLAIVGGGTGAVDLG